MTAAPCETRRADLEPELVDYRFVGAVDGTTLSYDPPIPGAPTELSLGSVVDIATTEPFAVRSQDELHPFLMAQMMNTANIAGGTRPGATLWPSTTSWSRSSSTAEAREST